MLICCFLYIILIFACPGKKVDNALLSSCMTFFFCLVFLKQEAIANFPFDWYALLTSDLGLSEAAFLNLLSHRFEMQLDAELTDAERRMVDNLRSTYSL